MPAEIDVTKINPHGALSIDQLCALDNISRAHYFRLRNLGLGPDEIREGKSVTISPQARQRWLREREQRSTTAAEKRKRKILAEHGRKGGRGFAAVCAARRKKAA
jgi:hypothetical protein